MSASFVDLTEIEQNVMVQMAQQRTAGLVELAAALWRTAPDWQAFDPYPLLTFVLDTLADRGLVKYRLRPPYGEHTEQPFDIRLTQDGWSLMGYAHLTVESGTRDTHRATAIRTTDGTNYRNQPFSAVGGPIETDTFADHKQYFPSHIHMYGDNQMETDMPRGYNKITPDMEALVLLTKEQMGPTATYEDVARNTDIPKRTVQYILADLPRLRRTHIGEDGAAKSLKVRIYNAVADIGDIKDVSELRRFLGMADTEHDVMHVLHSLHTQGRIDFDERGNGMGTATVVNIRLPKKGKPKSLPMPTMKDVRPEATTEEEPPHPTPSAPEPDKDEGYPLLDALLEREYKRLDLDVKAMSYITAAEAIEKVDPEMAASLMAKASALNATFPSPIEQEYMRYVANHPITKETE